MSTIQRETFAEAAPGVEALIEAHWREVALYQDAIPLEPDWDRYAKADAAGKLVVVTAREAGVLIGYSVFILNEHLHYSSCLVASNDVIYLRPEKRGIVGAKLIKRSEEILRGLGVRRMTWHIKPKNDWSSILARMDYDQEEIIMGKLLEN